MYSVYIYIYIQYQHSNAWWVVSVAVECTQGIWDLGRQRTTGVGKLISLGECMHAWKSQLHCIIARIIRHDNHDDYDTSNYVMINID